MLDLNIRQLEILNKVLREDFVSVDAFTSSYNISSRLCQMDIATINMALEKEAYDFSIQTKRNLGYHFDYDTDGRKRLLRHTNAYLDLSLIRYISQFPRIASMIRYLLLSEGFVRSDVLADSFYISNSTLSKDMKIIRQLLARYDITVSATPYRGTEIIGSQMSQLSALIDFCDWYEPYGDEPLIYQASLDDYNISNQEMKQLNQKILSTLRNSTHKITNAGFRRVLICCALLRHEKFNDLGLEPLPHMETFNEYHDAANLCALIGSENKQHRLLLSYLLISHLDYQNEISEVTHYALYHEAKLKFQEAARKLSKNIGIDLRKRYDLEKSLTVLTMTSIIRKRYGFIEYNIFASLRDVIDKVSASRALSLAFMRALWDDVKVMADSVFYDASLLIYNSSWLERSEYEMVHVLIVSDLSLSASRVVERRLELNPKFNVKYQYASSYEIGLLDLSKYNFIVNLSNTVKIEAQDIPVFHVDYFVHQAEVNIWAKGLINSRKFLAINQQMTKVRHVSLKSDSESFLSDLVAFFKKEDIAVLDLEAILKHEFYHHFTNDIGKTEKSLVLYTQKDLDFNVYVMDYEDGVQVGDDVYLCLNVFVMNPHSQFIAVKQLDSSTRRFQVKEEI